MQTQSSNSQLESAPKKVIQSWLVRQLAKQLSLDPKTIQVAEPLTRYGLDSIDAVTLVGDLEDHLELELPSTLFWDHPTIEKSADYLAENYDLNLANLSSIESLDPIVSKVEETPPSESKNKGWGKFWGK